MLGPNLKQEHFTDTVPNLTPNTGDINDSKGNALFWKVDDNVLYLSYHCNWRFINIKKAILALIDKPNTTLFVYSDVSKSSVVGNQVTDLLREIHYERKGSGDTYFEPLHIQYKDVRSSQMDIIHTQVAKKDGNLYQFGQGTTTVTLHFRRKKP